MPFKVTAFGNNRKPLCDFLLVINNNSHPTSYHFEVVAEILEEKRSLAFLSHRLGSSGTMYAVHLRLIGKPVMDSYPH